MPDISSEIKDLVEGEVSAAEADLRLFSHDASIFEVRPKLVVKPKNVADIKKLVSFVSEKKSGQPGLSLTARAAGSDMTGGPLNESIILDFTAHFNRIHEFGDDFAVVEPGVFYRDFEKETLKRGLILPSYPASREICALGGMVANNSGGEKTLKYGKTEKYVEEIKAVLSDGNEYSLKPLNKTELEEKIKQDDFEGGVYKKLFELLDKNHEAIKLAKPNVSKNSAGYALWNVWDKEKEVFDPTQLFVGSQGTLGIMTEFKIRLLKPEPYSKLLVIFMRDTAPLAGLVNKVLEFGPESFESYDDKTLRLVLRYFPSLVKLVGLKNIFKLAFSFWPEVSMTLRNGFPRLVLLAEFTGNSAEEVDPLVQRAEKALAGMKGIATHVAGSELEAKKYWTIRREAFNLIRHHLKKNQRSEPFIDDVIVTPKKLPEFLPKIYGILDEYKDRMTYALGGHSGDGNIHIYTIMNPKDPGKQKLIREVSEKVYDLVAEFEGSITAEHNDGLIRTPYLPKMFKPEIISLFEETKRIFDPMNIFNPGKKVGGSFEYAMNHIKKS